MNDRLKALVATCLFGLLVGCTAGSPKTENSDGKAKAGGNEDQPADSSEQSGPSSEDSPDVPVPIFLTAPDAALKGAASSVDAVTLGESDSTEMFASGATSKAYGDFFSEAILAVDEALKSIVADQFKNQEVLLKGGKPATFEVAGKFPPRLPVRYLRVSADVSVKPARYTVEAFCPAGSDAKTCLVITFSDSDAGKTPRVRLVSDWTETSLLIAGDWATLLEYGGGGDVVAAFRRANKTDGAVDHLFGMTVPQTSSADRRELALAMLNKVDGKKPLIQPDLPRPRFGRTERKAGDVWTLQGVAQASTGQLARRQTYIPVGEPATSLDLLVADTILRTVRDPLANPDCATTGDVIGGGLPDDLCRTTASTTDQQILQALASCETTSEINIDVVANRKTQAKVPVDLCRLEASRQAYVNPQLFRVVGDVKTRATDPEAFESLIQSLKLVEVDGQLAAMKDLEATKFPGTKAEELAAEADETKK